MHLSLNSLSLTHSMMHLAQMHIIKNLYFHICNKQQTKQSTKMGVLMSLLSLTIMLLLFFCETFDFLFKSTRISSYVEIDNKNSDQLLRVNFNVTLYDVQCEFVEVGTYILFWFIFGPWLLFFLGRCNDMNM